MVIEHDTGHTNVETAVDAILLIILDKGLDNCLRSQLINVGNVTIDECVFAAQICVAHYLAVDRDLFIVALTVLIKLMDHLERTILLLHLLINHWKIDNILSRIINHVLR